MIAVVWRILMTMWTKQKWLCALLAVLILANAFIIIKKTGVLGSLTKEWHIREFSRLHYDSTVWLKTTWLDVPAFQNPCDMWTMQEIITRIRPDFIVETGTAQGGSSLYFATILSQVNEKGMVITVDISPNVVGASKYPIFNERVEVITGDSVSQEVISRIADRVKGHTVLVTLDSLHTKDHVLKELKLYSKFVSLNSYLIVQDTNINGHPVYSNFGPGPMEALTEFLSDNKDFQIDRDMERQLLTYYPSGYLKRVR